MAAGADGQTALRRPSTAAHPRVGLRRRVAPEVATRQIELAQAHGIDGFLVDYYWYEDGAYLSGALDRGLLEAPNRDDVEFALMWANHELVDIFPHDPAGGSPRLLKRGAIDRDTFERMARRVIDAYFSRPNYLRIDGRPWFSVYEIGNLILGLGGVAETRDALAWFEAETIAAGHPGLHLDAVIWGVGVLPAAVEVEDPTALVEQLGFATATSYVWVHHAAAAEFDFPVGDVSVLREAAFAEYEQFARTLAVPFHPNVTVGWDPSPRLAVDAAFTRHTYPASPVFDADPAEFRRGLERAQRFLADHPHPHPLLTINAWNEWTEGSSLLPDTHFGLGYLEAVRDVFGIAGESPA